MVSDRKASTKYLKELSILLRSQGFIVHPGETRDIDVEHDGSTLCRINDSGNLGYFADKIAGKESILDRISNTARSTREYMTLLEQAPPLKADGLEDGYQLLAEFNGTVLAGHMTRYGAQFVTWEWVHNKTALWQGHYYGVGDSGGYQSAKRDFAVRSGLLPACALFKQEQLAEIYRSIHESLTFCGVYDARSGALYLAKDAMKPFTEGAYPFITEAGPSVLRELCGKINRRVEDVVNGDKPDGPAHGGFTMDHLPEAAFMAYLQDPESFLQTEAERYIQRHQEELSPQFLQNDALPAERQALARDAGPTMTIGGMNR